MQGNRALGLALIAAGAVLGGVMLLWVLVMLGDGRMTPGGAVFGLFLVAVLGLPLIGGGLYVLSRGKREAVEAAEFSAQRRTLEADRLFRAEQARELGQLARRVDAVGGAEAGLVANRLRDLVHDLENPSYDSAAWYEAVEIGRADHDLLRRYDDLLTDGVRLIAEQVGRLEQDQAAMPELRRTIQAWERDHARRSDLLRGRRGSSVAPTDVLGAEAGRSSTEVLTALKPGDALSRDGIDYLVETSVSYFAGGRTSWLHRLVAEQAEGWLYLGPGGLNLAWLTPTEVALDPGAPSFVHEGASCRLEESGLADARVRSRGGQEAGGSVSTWRYVCDDGHLLWVERWPDRTRAYSGRPISPGDLEIWPS